MLAGRAHEILELLRGDLVPLAQERDERPSAATAAASNQSLGARAHDASLGEEQLQHRLHVHRRPADEGRQLGEPRGSEPRPSASVWATFSFSAPATAPDAAACPFLVNEVAVDDEPPLGELGEQALEQARVGDGREAPRSSSRPTPAASGCAAWNASTAATSRSASACATGPAT